MRKHHHTRVNAGVGILSARGGPIDGDGVALEEEGEEEGDSPDGDNGDVAPNGDIYECALEYPISGFSATRLLGGGEQKLPFIETQDCKFC